MYSKWITGNPVIYYPYHPDVWKYIHHNVSTKDDSMLLLMQQNYRSIKNQLKRLFWMGKVMTNDSKMVQYTELIPNIKPVIYEKRFQYLYQDQPQCSILVLLNPADPYFKGLDCKIKLLKYFFCEQMKSTYYNIDSNIKNYLLVSQLKLCSNGQYISTLFMCDGVYDCSDKSDELGCYCFVNGIRNDDSVFCSKHCSQEVNCTCPILYTNEGLNGCSSYIGAYLHDNTNLTAPSPSLYSCNDSTVFLPEVLINDIIFDCPLGDDEPELLHGFSEQIYRCPEPYMYECYPGHIKCFTQGQKCQYSLSRKWQILLYCRNGKHLQGCRHIKCELKFKCPENYCIPYQYVCDGKWDCWNGADEINCQNYSCVSFFKCKYSKICIHTKTICDGVENCPFGDDELLCPQFKCSIGCECLNHGIVCINSLYINLNMFKYHIQHFIFINISQSILKITSFSIFKMAKILFLENNNLSFPLTCNSNAVPAGINILSLNFNTIVDIHEHNLFCMIELKKLFLKENKITVIRNHVFRPLIHLVILDLSHNDISTIKSFAFYNLYTIRFLNLKYNAILYIGNHIFSNSNKHSLLIHLDDFHLCCLARFSQIICTKTSKLIFTCTELLSNSVLKVTSWFMAALVLLFNMVVAIGYRTKIFRDKTLTYFEIYMLIINVCDLMIGLYLLIINVTDVTMGNKYVQVDKLWRSGIICHMAGFFYTLAILLSALFMVSISILRYFILNNPLESKTVFTRVSIPFIPLLIALALIVVIYVRREIENLQQLPSPLCILSANTDGSLSLKILTIFVAIYLLISFSILLIFYSKLIILVYKPNNILTKHKHRERQRNVAKNILLVGINNALSWLPTSIFYFMSVFTDTLNVNLLYWMVLFVIPINSLLNPIIFYYPRLRSMFKILWPSA